MASRSNNKRKDHKRQDIKREDEGRPERLFAAPARITGKTSMPPLGSSLRLLVKTRASNPLLRVRASHCESCGQNTHQQDKDCEDNSYLYWSNNERHDDGTIVPMGTSCGNCIETLVRFYPKGSNMSDVRAERARIDEAETRWARWRKDVANGANNFKDERANAKRETEVVQSKFDQAFVTGAFYELYEFANEKGVCYRDEQDLINEIKRKFGFECGVGKTGIMGVFAHQTPKKALYEYKMGVGDTLNLRDKERFDTQEAAIENYASMTSGHQQHLDSPWRADAGSPCSQGRARASQSTPHAPSTTLPSTQSQEHSDGGDSFSARSSIASGIHAALRSPTLVLNGHTQSKASSQYLAEASSQRVDDDEDSCIGSPSRFEGVGPKRKSHRTPLGDASLLEKARHALAEGKTILAPENMWARKIRQRQFENLMTKLATRANKVSTDAGSCGAAELGQELFKFCTRAEEMKSFMDDVRLQPSEFVSAMSTTAVKLWQTLNTTLQVHMCTDVANALLSTDSVEGVALAVKLANVVDRSSLGLGLVCGVDGDSDARAYLASAQHNIVSNISDRLAKRFAVGKFIEAMAKCGEFLGSIDLYCDGGGGVSGSMIDTQSTVINELGWTAQNHIDLLTLSHFAKLLAFNSGGKGYGRCPRELKAHNKVVELWKMNDLISYRLRVNMRVNVGTTFNNAKAGNDAVEEVSKDVVISITPDEARRVDRLVQTIGDCKAESLRLENDAKSVAYHSLLCDVIEDKDLVATLRRCSSYCDDVVRTGDGHADEYVAKCSAITTDLLSMFQDIMEAQDHFRSRISSWMRGDMEAELHIERHPKEYDKKGADDSDDPWEIFEWVACVADALKQLQISASERDVLEECFLKSTLLVACVKLLTRSEADGAPQNVLKGWAEIWEPLARAKAVHHLSIDQRCRPFQVFSESISPELVSVPILAFIRKVVSKDPTSPLFLTALEEMCGSLPAHAKLMLASVQARQSLAETATDISLSRSVGILTCTSVLHKASLAVPPVSEGATFRSNIAVVTTTWGDLLKELAHLLDTSRAVTFVKQYKDLLNNAIVNWSFTGHLAFLTAPKSTPEVEAESSSMEHFILGATTMGRIVRDMEPWRGSLPWAKADQIDTLSKLIDDLARVQDVANDCAYVLGAMVLSNSVLTDSMTDGYKNYVVQKLGVALTKYPVSFQHRVAEALKGVGASTSKVGVADAKSSTPSHEPRNGTAAQDAGVQPAKRFKRKL